MKRHKTHDIMQYREVIALHTTMYPKIKFTDTHVGFESSQFFSFTFTFLYSLLPVFGNFADNPRLNSKAFSFMESLLDSLANLVPPSFNQTGLFIHISLM